MGFGIVLLAFAVGCTVLEIFTKRLVALFAVPAFLCASVLAFIQTKWWLVLLFGLFIFAVGVSAGRAVLIHFKQKARPDSALTSILGKTVTVCDTVNNAAGGGEVRAADGAMWAARSLHGELLSAGETVRVIAVDGVRVVVDR